MSTSAADPVSLSTGDELAGGLLGEPRGREAAGRPAPPISAPAPASRSLTQSRFWTVVASHAINDIYPTLYPTLVIALRNDLGLTDGQIAILYASNQIASGLPQAASAWWSDRHDTRITGPLGLTLSTACACLIGFAPNFLTLWLLLTVAMVGNGMFHPIAGAQAGQLGGRVLRRGRGMAVSLFFAAGMLGSIIGPLAGSRINEYFGLRRLVWLLPLGLAGALILRLVTARVAHREFDHHVTTAAIPPQEHAARWYTLKLLFVGNSLRYIVNTAMYIMFNIWAARALPMDHTAATSLNGNLVVAMTFGMGVSALMTGWLVKPGQERGAIMWLSVAGFVFTSLMAVAGRAAASTLGMWPIYGCAALCSLAFASIMPITIGLAQRLLPGRTSLATSIMMGVAWAVAAVAPWTTQLFLGSAQSAALNLPTYRLDIAFLLFGVLLLIAGLLGLAMPKWIIKRVSENAPAELIGGK